MYVVERAYVRKEYYFALVQDRTSQGPIIIASSQGGMDIEAVAAETPEAIVTHPIDINVGLRLEDAKAVAQKLGFSGNKIDKVIIKLNLNSLIFLGC